MLRSAAIVVGFYLFGEVTHLILPAYALLLGIVLSLVSLLIPTGVKQEKLVTTSEQTLTGSAYLTDKKKKEENSQKESRTASS